MKDRKSEKKTWIKNKYMSFVIHKLLVILQLKRNNYGSTALFLKQKLDIKLCTKKIELMRNI